MAHYSLPGVNPAQMTVKQKLQEMLYNLAVPESASKTILDYAIPLMDAEIKEKVGYQITWDSFHNDYPNVLYGIFFNMLKPHVYQWGQENLPQAWWLPVFQPN